MTIYKLPEHTPQIDDSCYVAKEAAVIGWVTLKKNASVWPCAVIRGDNELIEIGESSNIQEGAVLHTDMGCPLTIGDFVTVGHQAMLHGCTVGEGSLIGIQAVILNKAKIGKECLVGAGALVTEGKEFPDRSLIVGSPAKVVRTLTDEDIARMRRNNAVYVEKQHYFQGALVEVDKAGNPVPDLMRNIPYDKP